MSAPPIMPFFWDGEAMRPRLPKLADRHFVVGETYPLEVREDRSGNSHRHYFAAVTEAHKNLPDELAERWPSPEHLRKFALVKTGYREERTIVCASAAEATKMAALVKNIDDFSVIVTEGPIVTVYTAKSQSMRAMPKGEFQASKDAVLGFVASLIGTDRETLEQHTREAA